MNTIWLLFDGFCLGAITTITTISFFRYLSPDVRPTYSMPDNRPIIGVWLNQDSNDNATAIRIADNWPLRPGFVMPGVEGRDWGFIRGEIAQ